MSHPAHETPELPVVSDLETGPEAPQPGASSEPIWLYDLELASASTVAPEPPPTPAMPRAQVEQLIARSTEDDPFEAFLRVNKITTHEPCALTEPTVVDANPAGAAGERWWVDPPKASAPRQRRATGELPRLTPPQWKGTRPTMEMRAPRPTPPAPTALPPPLPPKKPFPKAVATVFGGALIGALVVVLLGSSTSSATELMVPPPPPAPLVELVAVKIQPNARASVPSPPVGEKDRVRGARPTDKREAAKKKWAAEEWPEVEAPKPLEEPKAEAPPADELKRPAF